ncbi:MAG: metallophosphoesterase [Deltaproteobacteria bacterium]|jgi:predicted MPP superfamily phosphohydrolase|nr:metallophosphoesterase [Deltaproteobacteria bacterium]
MPLTLICLIALIFSVWYVPFRFKRLGTLKRSLPLGAIAAALLAAYIILLAKGFYLANNLAAAWSYNALGLFFVFWIYLFFLLLITNLLALLIKKLPGKHAAYSAIVISLALVVFGFFKALSFSVTEIEIAVPKLTQEVTIVHIPDVHLGAQRGEGRVIKIVETINSLNPDIVVYNGDIADSNIALSPKIFEHFKKVKAKQYFTTGNHEFYIDTEKLLKLVEQASIKILRSEMVETNGLQLIGLEYMNADRQTYDAHMVNNLTIEEELPKITRSPSLPTILVHHSPVGLKYVSIGKIDLILSGHTHAGQFFPGTLIIPFRFPMYKGKYQIGPTTLLVSQGAGTFGPWMRLGTFNEIQLVRLIPQK